MFAQNTIHTRKFLFIDREDIDTGEKFLQIMKSRAPYNIVTNQTCIPITAFRVKVGNTNAMYVAGNNLLERWVITSDSKQLLPVIVAQTKYVCFIFIIVSNIAYLANQRGYS